MDTEKPKIGKGILVLFGVETKTTIAVGITKNLMGKYDASKILKDISKSLGGKEGGGRPDFAMTGVPKALELKEIKKAFSEFSTI